MKAAISLFRRLDKPVQHTRKSLVKPKISTTLSRQSPASYLLNQSTLIIGRQVEMLNVFLGYEQANKYQIKNESNDIVAYIAEDGETVFTSSIARQIMRTRRAFHATVLDLNGNAILKIMRPIKWLLNSRISILDADNVEIGHVHQTFHVWRRKYDIFDKRDQYALIDAPLLSWDFDIQLQDGSICSSVNRNFSGLAREIFTDSGQYVVRFDDSLSLDQRAIVLATAVNIDIDYFSRHSGIYPLTVGNGGFLPLGLLSTSTQTPSAPAPVIIPGSDSSELPAESSTPSPFSTGSIWEDDASSKPSVETPKPPPSPENKWGDDDFVKDDDIAPDSGFVDDGDQETSWGSILGKVREFMDD